MRTIDDILDVLRVQANLPTHLACFNAPGSDAKLLIDEYDRLEMARQFLVAAMSDLGTANRRVKALEAEVATLNAELRAAQGDQKLVAMVDEAIDKVWPNENWRDLAGIGDDDEEDS